MSRRKVQVTRVIALAMLLLAVTLFIWGPSGHADRITRENFDRIQKGVTRAEVEEILGPPEDYSTGPTSMELRSHRFGLKEGRREDRQLVLEYLLGNTGVAWQTDSDMIIISYAGDLVDNKGFCTLRKEERNPLQDFAWRIAHRIERWFV
jgi:hypothetical protein